MSELKKFPEQKTDNLLRKKQAIKIKRLVTKNREYEENKRILRMEIKSWFNRIHLDQ